MYLICSIPECFKILQVLINNRAFLQTQHFVAFSRPINPTLVYTKTFLMQIMILLTFKNFCWFLIFLLKHCKPLNFQECTVLCVILNNMPPIDDTKHVIVIPIFLPPSILFGKNCSP